MKALYLAVIASLLGACHAKPTEVETAQSELHKALDVCRLEHSESSKLAASFACINYRAAKAKAEGKTGDQLSVASITGICPGFTESCEK